MTTGNDADQVLVGANGRVWIAPIDSTMPDDVGTDIDDSVFTEVGFLSEDGVTFSAGKNVNRIGAWQSFFAIRRTVQDRTVTAAFMLRQWNRANVEFALEGTVDDNGGEFVFTPNPPETLSENALVVEWTDGDKHYRLLIPRGDITQNVDTKLTRTDAADLPITFEVLDPGNDEMGDPIDVFSIFTDDPAFAAISS